MNNIGWSERCQPTLRELACPAKTRDPREFCRQKAQCHNHRAGRGVFYNTGLRFSKAACKVLQSLCLYNCPSFRMKGNLKKIEIKIHYSWKHKWGVVLYFKRTLSCRSPSTFLQNFSFVCPICAWWKHSFTSKIFLWGICYRIIFCFYRCLNLKLILTGRTGVLNQVQQNSFKTLAFPWDWEISLEIVKGSSL